MAVKPYQRAVTFASRVEHPDDWLLPIDPETWIINRVAWETTENLCIQTDA